MIPLKERSCITYTMSCMPHINIHVIVYIQILLVMLSITWLDVRLIDRYERMQQFYVVIRQGGITLVS